MCLKKNSNFNFRIPLIVERNDVKLIVQAQMNLFCCWDHVLSVVFCWQPNNRHIFKWNTKLYFNDYSATLHCVIMYLYVSFQCNGVLLTPDSTLEGIAILNINSVYGGSNLWGESTNHRKTTSLSSNEQGVSKVSLLLGH